MISPDTGAEVRRTLSQPPDKVFAAFADRRLVAAWLRPSPDIKLTVLDFDFRVGGAYRFAYEEPSGQQMFVDGVYWEIERPRRIVSSWLIEPPDEHAGIESQVTVLLAARDAGTDLTIRHEKFGRADADLRHAQGWTGALDLLEARLGQEG